MKPKLSHLLALAPAALATLAPLPAGAAAVDYFLRIDGVEGESTDKSHSKEIVLDSFTIGASNTATASAAGGAATGKATFSDLLSAAKLSKASPKLYLQTANGTHIGNVLLSVRKSGSNFDFYTVKLVDVLITSVQTQGKSGEIPTESVSMNYSKITWTYTPTDTKGAADTPISTTWDIKAGKGS